MEFEQPYLCEMTDRTSWCQKYSSLTPSGYFVRWPFSIPLKIIRSFHIILTIIIYELQCRSLTFCLEALIHLKQYFFWRWYSIPCVFSLFLQSLFLLGPSNSWEKKNSFKISCWYMVFSQVFFYSVNNFSCLISVPAPNIDSCVLTYPLVA